LIPSENEKYEFKGIQRVLIMSEDRQKLEKLSEQKKQSVPKLSLKGSSSNGHSNMKGSVDTDKILPGQASKSLVEQ
jgi:hypothetical protein